MNFINLYKSTFYFIIHSKHNIFLRDELVSLEQNFADVESERARLEEERIEYQVII